MAVGPAAPSDGVSLAWLSCSDHQSRTATVSYRPTKPCCVCSNWPYILMVCLADRYGPTVFGHETTTFAYIFFFLLYSITGALCCVITMLWAQSMRLATGLINARVDRVAAAVRAAGGLSKPPDDETCECSAVQCSTYQELFTHGAALTCTNRRLCCAAHSLAHPLTRPLACLYCLRACLQGKIR
jgi:hypothetical protein